MPITMHQFSIPVFVRGLRALAGYLEKGRADAEARKFGPEVLIESRLAPDMHKLSRQVQIASDTVKNAAARLAGQTPPSYPDTESTFEELQERITKTITRKFPGQEMTFNGADYLTGFALPNFYFHLAMAYAILRNNGVQIGKRDFMGA